MVLLRNTDGRVGIQPGKLRGDAFRGIAPADGYIIEMYRGGKWVRIARIAGNDTVTYRVSGLAGNTAYQFRIKAYKMSGSTALYSGYTTISGKTTA